MIIYQPVNPESAVERIDFYRGDEKITLVNRFDSFTVYVDEDEDDFDVDSYDPDQGTMMTFADEESGECVQSEVEGDVTDQEKQSIIDAFASRLEGGVADLGWTWSDREVWFYGPIRREQE